MATYKVIQDIEAEDKFLGPLTLKQFIFGAIAAFFGYLSFYFVTQGAAFMLAVFMPISLLGAFLAIPWSSEQPTEVWVLAKLRFKFKPQTRLWDQAGLEELVTITAPKKEEKVLTDSLSQDEIKSRLQALAQTIDTRGWATKNASIHAAYVQNDQRLINPLDMPRQVPEIDINAYPDVLNDDTTISANFQHLMQDNSDDIKRQSLERMERIRRGESVEIIGQPEVQFTAPTDSYFQEASDDPVLTQQLHQKRAEHDIVNTRMQRLPVYPVGGGQLQSPPASQPVDDDDDQVSTEEDQAQAQMTKPVDPGILELANNNDLNIATLARQAKKKDSGDGEVVVSLR